MGPDKEDTLGGGNAEGSGVTQSDGEGRGGAWGGVGASSGAGRGGTGGGGWVGRKGSWLVTCKGIDTHYP